MPILALSKMVKRLAVSSALVAVTVGAFMALVRPAYAGSDTLPAYTADGFCVTQTINYFHNVKERNCTGLYKVTRATYKFTEHNLHVCLRMSIMVHLDETWVSGPQGGEPTILAHYHAYL